MTSLAQAPARFTPDELAESGRRSDLLPLVDPNPCSCGEADCSLCSDAHAAELADALGLDDDAPAADDLDWHAGVRSVEQARREGTLALHRRLGFLAGRDGLASTPPPGLEQDAELFHAFADGWIDGADEFRQTQPLSEAILDRAEYLGWRGEDPDVEGLCRQHEAEYLAAWREGRRIRARDEAELAAEGFGRRDLLA